MDKAMRQVGFVGYSKEWWHYSDNNQNFKAIQVNPANY
jgi:D-alanyl-D-alanine dipeptidase